MTVASPTDEPLPPVLPLRTTRLLLRAHVASDRDFLLSYYSDPEVTAYLPWSPWTVEDAARAISSRLDRTGLEGKGRALALIVEAAGEPVGDVVLWPSDDTLLRGEVGWALHLDHQGNGFAREAARAMLGVAFDHYCMRRVIARVDPRNTTSIAICESLHMTLEAHLRQDTQIQGKWVDTLVYGMLRSEWQQKADQS